MTQSGKFIVREDQPDDKVFEGTNGPFRLSSTPQMTAEQFAVAFVQKLIDVKYLRRHDFESRGPLRDAHPATPDKVAFVKSKSKLC